MTLQLGEYLCRYDANLNLCKCWRGGTRVIVSTELEEGLWEDFENEIRDEAEKHYIPDFGELFQDNEQNRYQ